MKGKFILIAFICLYCRLSAQTISTIASGEYYTALAHDASGNLYTTRFDRGSGSYQVVKYLNGSGVPQVLLGGLKYGGLIIPGGNECGDFVCETGYLNCPKHSLFDEKNRQPLKGETHMIYPSFSSGGRTERVTYKGCVLEGINRGGVYTVVFRLRHRGDGVELLYRKDPLV